MSRCLYRPKVVSQVSAWLPARRILRKSLSSEPASVTTTRLSVLLARPREGEAAAALVTRVTAQPSTSVSSAERLAWLLMPASITGTVLVSDVSSHYRLCCVVYSLHVMYLDCTVLTNPR